ncbi:MAG: hypothetical protein QXO15_12815 [Nitrososphaerota archaeon]
MSSKHSKNIKSYRRKSNTVRNRLLTDRERKVLEAYLNLKPYTDEEQRFLYVILHRIRKLDLDEIMKDLEIIKKIKEQR